MPFKSHTRQYDIVVLGATGYTGKLTAENITTNLPTNLKWAVAGRSKTKLEQLVNNIKILNPDRIQPVIEICDLEGPDLVELAQKTFILITTVGPYSKYGEHAFKACAENGTHYLDVTGEVPWVSKMIKKYEASAKLTGAIMVPEVGLESSPADLLVYSIVALNRSHFGAKTKEAVVSLHSLSSSASGGTIETGLTMFDHHTLTEMKEALAPFALSPIPHPKPDTHGNIITMLTGLRTVPNLGLLTSSITSKIDCAIVGRSWGLMNSLPSRQKQAYGPNFTVSEYMKTRNHLTGVAMHIGLIVAGFLLATIPALRQFIKRYVYQPGDGPTKEQAAKDEIEFRAVAWPDVEQDDKDVKGAGKQAYGRVVYYGSMYALTGLFLSQAALTILEEDLQLDGGVYTPACLGEPFIDRVAGSGFKIETRILDLH